jgi:hypothetical protein
MQITQYLYGWVLFGLLIAWLVICSYMALRQRAEAQIPDEEDSDLPDLAHTPIPTAEPPRQGHARSDTASVVTASQ